jgi:dTDP-4-dehydrorhamnose reductase
VFQLNPPARVLLTGGGGQVGRALIASAPVDIDLRVTTHADLDITDATQVSRYLAGFKPTLVINAAAYTAVDRAESDEVAARRANIDGPQNLARALLDVDDSRLIQISTDYVFNGKACSPYLPTDEPAPLSAYGRTKLGGEQRVLAELGARALVLRTGWVYAAQGANFLRTMLRLMTTKGEVGVVDDQVGTPTSAPSLADAIWAFSRRPELFGVFHWSDAGVASWYDFAVAIAEEAEGKLLSRHATVWPIATHEYPTPARRPQYSILDKRSAIAALGLNPVHWRTKLRSVIESLVVA